MRYLPPGVLSALLLCSAATAGLFLYRMEATGTTHYAWLLLPNLVLAWIPLLAVLALDRLIEARRFWALWLPLGTVWLLFLPNAPYIITDFIHLTWVPTRLLIYYDMALLGLAAITGLILGYASLYPLHRRVEAAWGRAVGWALVGGVWMLAAGGMALGRVSRWNSWDVLHSLEAILRDLVTLPETFWFVGAFGVLLLTLYHLFYRLLGGRAG